MNDFLTGTIELSENESATLVANLRNPDEEYIILRDAVFAEADEAMTIRVEGTDYLVDIPNLDLSFIDEESVSAEVYQDEKATYTDFIEIPRVIHVNHTFMFCFETEYSEYSESLKQSFSDYRCVKNKVSCADMSCDRITGIAA